MSQEILWKACLSGLLACATLVLPPRANGESSPSSQTEASAAVDSAVVDKGTPETAASDEAAATGEPSLAERIDQTLRDAYIGPEIPLASDTEFLRRIYLDLIGRGPTVAEAQAFLARAANSPDGPATARHELIDDLLARGEFSRYYAKVLEVAITERRDEKIGPIEFRRWIQTWLNDRRPLNELYLEILAADGTGEELRPAASFVLNRNAEPNLVTRDVGRIFFGRDVRCAQCHDHPLVGDYAQSEYFGILSFVNRTYLFQDEKRGNTAYLGEKGEGVLEFSSVFRPEDGKSIAQPVLPETMAMDTEPNFVDTEEAYVVAPDKDKRGIPRYSRRQQLAVLATHPENQSFNRNLANRIWASMMGVGVVYPVDMHHSENRPVSSALLQLLADEMVESQYDLREILRQIALSDTYQRSSLAPDLQNWEGPAGGIDRLEVEKKRLEDQRQQLTPQMEGLTAQMSEAAKRLHKCQADVQRQQEQNDEAKKKLQSFTEHRDKETARLKELQTKQGKHAELMASLQAAVKEADKILQITPEDHELKSSHTLLTTRLTSATEAKPTLDQQVNDQQEAVQNANHRVDDQRSRVFALANRGMALGEFVVEARGGQRRVRKEIQALVDAQADCGQQLQRIDTLRKWLEMRDQVQKTRSGGDTAAAAELEIDLNLLQSGLLETWRRDFAIRRIRSLSAEQLAGATYFALEMDRSVRAKAIANWTANQHPPAQPTETTATDTAEGDKTAADKTAADNTAADKIAAEQMQARDRFAEDAIAANQWDTVEDLIVGRFSLPAGAPQDGFFATVDQALTIQNDPTFLNWIKSSEGNLVERLLGIDDHRQLAEQLYGSVLNRGPDPEEVAKVSELLTQYSAERTAIVQELIWGLLASAEFRFVL